MPSPASASTMTGDGSGYAHISKRKRRNFTLGPLPNTLHTGDRQLRCHSKTRTCYEAHRRLLPVGIRAPLAANAAPVLLPPMSCMRYCIGCRYWHFTKGEQGHTYSTMTVDPAIPAAMACKKGHWGELDLGAVYQSDIEWAMEKANTCPDSSERQAE